MHILSWGAYGTFVLFAVFVVVAPGPDFAVLTRSVLAGGRRAGMWTSVGSTVSNLVRGTAVAFGVGALIVRSQPLFQAVRVAGIAYLCWLGVQALRSARRSGEVPEVGGRPGSREVPVWSRFGTGFLSNITNPKVLVFYLAVLPQFLDARAGFGQLFLYAASHALIGLCYLLLLVVFLHQMRPVLARRSVRRGLDALTGMALLGFGARLTTEHT